MEDETKRHSSGIRCSTLHSETDIFHLWSKSDSAARSESNVGSPAQGKCKGDCGDGSARVFSRAMRRAEKGLDIGHDSASFSIGKARAEKESLSGKTLFTRGAMVYGRYRPPRRASC